MEVFDEYGISAAIVLWQTQHPDVMLPPHVFGADPTSNQTVHLVSDEVDSMSEQKTVVLGDVAKCLLPLLSAIALGREPSYLGQVIKHHEIYHPHLDNCVWNTHGGVQILGTHHAFNETDLSIEFFRAVNASPDLVRHAEFELNDGKYPSGFIVLDDERFSIKHRFLNADVEQKHELLELSSRVAHEVDFANDKYWPKGGVGVLIDRAGGYLADVLYGDELHRVQPDLDPDFWYSFFKDSLRELSREHRVEYLSKVMSSVDENNDQLFYKGLRVLEVYSEVDDDILGVLKDIELAAGDKGSRLITDLQLLKGIVDPRNAGEALAEEGYTDRFESKLFVHNVFTELLAVGHREINHADLKAFSKIQFMHGKDQDLSQVDVPKLLVQVLNAYESKCDWFKKTALISDDLAKSVSYLKEHLPLDLGWTNDLGQEGLQLLTLGGVKAHEMLTYPSRAKVFMNELNL